MIIFFIILILVLYAITNYAFKSIILSKRKTKEDAFSLLKERSVYEESNFDESIFEKLEINSEDNLKLKGYYVKNKDISNKVIVIVHGYTANYYMSLQFLSLYLNEGFNVLLIDNRSHGNSEGKYVTYGMKEKEDLKNWINLLKDKLDENISIGIHGQSMGAATALMYAGKYKDVDFVVSDCAYSSGREILKYQFKHIVKILPYPLYQMVNTMIKLKCSFSMNKVTPIKDISNIDIPILFIHGKNDKIIPYTMSLDMYNKRNNNKDKLLIIEDADHVESFMYDKSKYTHSIKTFLNEIYK